MRAKEGRGGACRTRTRDRVPVAHGVEEDPNRRGHPIGVRGEGEGGAGRLAERGSWAGWAGLRGEKLGREKKRRKKEGWAVWAEIKGRKKKSFCIFELIQTIQFKLKFREFKFELNNKQ